MSQADIAVIGLAVMGENLVLNLESKGFTVAVHNRTVEKVEAFVNGRGRGKRIIGVRSIEDLPSVLKCPRKVLLMVKAGQPVDQYIEKLLPLLEPGDIIIDGGNSHFTDTIRRTSYVESKGLLFIGTGISGGEEGALHGPAIMPGGSKAAWPHVKQLFQSIAARAPDGTPCCDWIGENGAGHFVKMVHNGIEYGDMQLIAESYHVMKSLLGMTAQEMHRVFKRWNQGELQSYLIEITRDILAYRDIDGAPLVERILDSAGQKGTGKWTGISALELGVPLTLIAEAVFARCLSAMKEEREAASTRLTGPAAKRLRGRHSVFLADLRNALYASKIVSYAQGFALMRAAAREYSWNLNYGGIALIWRGGCIIRSAFLSRISEAFRREPSLSNLMLDPFFARKLRAAQAGWRRVVATAAEHGIPIPSMASALAYYDGYRSAWLPANLVQAQRDYFGAHTYERIDKPRGQFFHTNWTGRGGETISGSYSV